MIILELIQNIALLIALAAVYQVIGARLSPRQLRHQVLSGLLFGGVGLVAMLTPLTLQPGLIFDGRSIILSVAGLFGGPFVALVAAVMCAAYRLWLGGPGAWVGVTVIAEAAALGILFHYVFRRSGRPLTWPALWGLGFLVHVAMLATMLALPGGAGPDVVRQIGLSVLLFFPSATVLVCLLFLDSERQLALKAALAESEEKHRVLLDEAADPIFSLSPAGRYRYVNKAFAAMVGRARDQIIGRSIGEVFSGAAAEAREAALRDVVRSGEVMTFEATAPGPDGDRIYLKTYQPVKAADGQLISVIGTAKDITERQQLAATLEREQRFLRQVIDHIPSIVCVKDRDSRFVLANAALAGAYGMTVQDLEGKTDADLSLTPEQVSRYHRDDLRTIDGRETVVVPEESMRFADGTTHWLWAVKVPLVRDDGSCDELLAVTIDITERKEAEAALESERRFLRQVIDHIPSIVCVKDRDSRFVLANEAVARAYGVTVADLLGKTDADFSPTPDEVNCYHRDDLRTIDGRETVVVPEESMRFADGTTHWLSTVKVPLIRDDGGCDELLAVTVDITERKAAEAEQQRLQAQMLQMQKMEAVGRLAGGVAHDFNNMLTAILGYAELGLAEAPPDSAMHRRLLEIQHAAQRSAELTRQLLGFARKQMADPRVLDLNDTVAGMLKMLRRLIGEDIEVAWLPGAGLWPVKIDPAQVDQVLANLCLNARDAIGGVGKVTIETENVTFDAAYCADHAGFLPGDYAMLGVSDNGRGMQQDTLAHIFEPFFTTKGVGQGTGLGLATVYGIVKQNDGFINVYSEPGVGTTFKVYLPRAAEAASQAAPPPSRPIAPGSETVLVVEDEPMLLDMGKAMLTQLGYTVLTAGRPAEALQLVEAHTGPIHLLITDVVMPGMNGRELAARVRVLKPGIKTLFMSGYTANVIAHRGVLDEGMYFIQKPFSVQALADQVRAALEH